MCRGVFIIAAETKGSRLKVTFHEVSRTYFPSKQFESLSFFYSQSTRIQPQTSIIRKLPSRGVEEKTENGKNTFSQDDEHEDKKRWRNFSMRREMWRARFGYIETTCSD